MKISSALSWFKTRSLIMKIIVIAIVGIIGWFVWSKFSSSSTQTAQYQTEKVERGTLIVSVSASGQVSSTNNGSVTTDASGVVSNIYVKNGDTVNAGDTIAEVVLDTDGLQKQASAYATYMSAINSANTAEQNKLTADASMWSAQKAVLDAQNEVDYKNANIQNPSTKKDYTGLEKQSIESSLIEAHKSFTANETKYKQADSAVAAAKAQLTSAWYSYQKSVPVIKAPLSGTISGLTIQVGTVIASQGSSSTSTASTSTSSSSSGQKVASIKTVAHPVISVNLSEVDVPKVQTGDKATITFDAYTDKTYTGVITSVDTSGTTSSGVTTYPALVQLDVDAPEILSNMSATANIITDTKDNVLLVPSTTVQTQNDQTAVRVMKNGQMKSVEVETGAVSDTQTEIVSGLSEGDTVVTGTVSSSTGSTTSTQTSPFNAFGRGNFRIGGR